MTNKNNDVKVCKKCKYCFRNWNDKLLCSHEKSIWTRDLIDGETFYTTCDDMRYHREECGREGKLFERKGFPKIFRNMTARKRLNLILSFLVLCLLVGAIIMLI